MSYLISKGSINNFAIQPTVLAELHELPFQKLLRNNLDTKNFSEINHAIDIMDMMSFGSDTIVGDVFLKELTLRKNFEGTLANLFKPRQTQNEVYFLVWSWDLSGNKFYVYPSEGVNADEWIKPMKKDDTSVFMHGDGLPIFPRGEIKNGVGIHIEVWESDKGIRKAGEKLLKAKKAINDSDLIKITAGLTTITAPNLALIEKATSVLSGMIGNILKANGDDHIALFEGYFEVDKWRVGPQRWKEPTENDPACEITIERN